MGYSSSIDGSIEGVSEESFALIRQDLECIFVEVSWHPETVKESRDPSGQVKKTVINKGGALEIHSHGKHNEKWLHAVYDKIAFCIDEGGGGYLEYEGEETCDIRCVFFTTRLWKEAWIEVAYPQNPFIQNDAAGQF